MKSLQKWKQLLCSVRNQPNVRVMSMSSETCSEENGTSNLFDDIVLKRHFTHEFNPGRNIDRLLMKKLITLSQSAPSSFNLQPFKIIVVDNESVKEVLAESMIGLNSVRVRTAPVTVVYLSDKEPAKLLRQLMALELSCGTDPSYVNTLPSTFGLLFGNGGWLSTKIRIAVSHLRSPIQPSPVIPNETLSWSIKNTIFAAQTFMLAATANGLGTAPMEGFDERRLCQSLNIPTDRYAVPLVISVGYPKEEVPLETDIQKVHTTRRYPLSDICFSNSFGTPTSY